MSNHSPNEHNEKSDVNALVTAVEQPGTIDPHSNVTVELTESEWFTLHQALMDYSASIEKPLSRTNIITIISWLSLLLLIAYLLNSYSLSGLLATLIVFFLPPLLILFKFIRQFRLNEHKVKVIRRARKQCCYANNKACQVQLSSAGIETQGLEENTAQVFLPWSMVSRLEESAEHLIVYFLHGGIIPLILWLPRRCFDNQSHFSHFRELLAEYSQRPIEKNHTQPCVIATSSPYSQQFKRAVTDLFDNLSAGFWLLFGRPQSLQKLHPSVLQCVLLSGLFLFFNLTLNMVSIGTDGEINRIALFFIASALLFVCIASWLIAMVAKRENQTIHAITALLAIGLPLYIFFHLIFILSGHSTINGSWDFRIYIPLLFLAWFIYSASFTLLFLYAIPIGRKAAVPLVLFALLFAAFQPARYSNYDLWEESYSMSSEEEARYERRQQLMAEKVFYQQADLLSNTLRDIPQGRENLPEVYLLAVGGSSAQDVFMHEVKGINELFRERFALDNRGVILLNNPDTAEVYPFATVTALTRVLTTLGQRMNTEEDILFLYMTSHGSRDFEFAFTLYPYQFDSITPEILRQLLDQSGIKNRVIVMSACYSGGFVTPLQNEDTLVITAARPDRTSYGCSYTADWTFFGRAYFNEALRTTYSFVDAFRQAQILITQQETAEGYQASEPQMALGEQIAVRLRALEQQFEAH